MQLVPITSEEKEKLRKSLKSNFIFRGMILICLALLSIILLVYFNNYENRVRYADNLEVLNVVFIVAAVVCGRFFIAEGVDYNKEMRSDNKKVVRTKVLDISNGRIKLGNKYFSKEKVLIDNSEFDSLNAGDDILLELSSVSNTIFSVKKAS